MSRDQRIRDNWALLYAQHLGLERQRPLVVVFVLTPSFLEARPEQFAFMLRGLRQLEADLQALGLAFALLPGQPEDQLPAFVARYGISSVVADFDPLRPKREWLAEVCHRIDIPVYQVDAHNIVPCWAVSGKLEYAARTIRPKLRQLLPHFLQEFPAVARHPFSWSQPVPAVDWANARGARRAACRGSLSVEPGEMAARQGLRTFINNRLAAYATARNDPNAGGQSGLSPFLHFGQISAQRVALDIQNCDAPTEAKNAFLEELIIRRELADNYCWYNPRYDQFAGLPSWGQSTLNRHRSDIRPYLYAYDEFESATTHDSLWNAAQMEMVKTGTMPGYLRMYWAKKILEWSASPEEALATAIRLNNRYELDGRDPNGYAGIAWSIGGVHDRPWAERPVYGMIRYMNYAGCARKFDVPGYIERVARL